MANRCERASSTMSEIPYSTRLTELESIVQRLQQGVDLDEAMELYRKGKELYSSCEKTLLEAERALDEKIGGETPPSGA